jgi:hypothetical protein
MVVVRRAITSPLIIVEDKAKVLEMEAIFENSKGILIWWFYGVHDRGDME